MQEIIKKLEEEIEKDYVHVVDDSGWQYHEPQPKRAIEIIKETKNN